MGLTLSSVFGRLFGKKQMRILMGNFLLLLLVPLVFLATAPGSSSDDVDQ